MVKRQDGWEKRRKEANIEHFHSNNLISLVYNEDKLAILLHKSNDIHVLHCICGYGAIYIQLFQCFLLFYKSITATHC